MSHEWSALFHETQDKWFKALLQGAFMDESEILRNHPDYGMKLKEYLEPVQVGGKQWRLCFRASDNQYSSSAFHAACDNKGPTVTLLRVGDLVSGGYADKSWNGNIGAIYSNKTFLFSLKNRDNEEYKMMIFQNEEGAMYSLNASGPDFGSRYDLHMLDNCHITNSRSNLGHAYKLPDGYTVDTEEARSLLVGSYYFKCDEYEVFYQQ